MIIGLIIIGEKYGFNRLSSRIYFSYCPSGNVFLAYDKLYFDM